MDTTLTQPLADSDTYKAQSSSNTVAQNADKLDEQTFIKQLLNNNRKRLQSFPDKQTAEEFIEELFRFLFVGEAQAIDEERLSEQYKSLKNTFAALLFVRQILFLGWPLDFFVQSISTGSLLLFSFFMITDPKTTPNHSIARIVWAAVVAAVAFYLATFHFVNGAPVWVLILSQPLVPVLDHVFKEKLFEWNTPILLHEKESVSTMLNTT